jgi:hypothetical protein
MEKWRFSLIATAALTASFAVAQGPPPDTDSNQPADDPPSRAARLSFASGTVSFQPASVEDWVPATLNRPLTTGDRLWTEAGSRAEVHLGSAAFRLNGRTNFTFINLTDTMTQVQVSTGSVSVRVRRLDDQESFEIDTPQAAFSLLRPGEYRVDVNEQGDATVVTVRGGQGEVTADNQVQSVHPREQMRISETGDGHAVFDQRDAPVADSFDNFCQDRDRREDRSESARHVSRDVPGFADLDEHGVWREDQQYGWIWAPRVEVGWAPYHQGHWAWIAPWGWTWVDDAPWGYAPFHYGRWAFVGAAWVWVPGPPAVRPVYAPALVAWVGGPRFGVGISVGGGAAVGWFPLGPGEVWRPAYRASPRYFTQVNVSNTVINRNVNITNVNVTNVTYVNQRVNGAVMAVPRNAMGNGRPVAQVAVRLQANEVASAQIERGPVVAPERTAVMGGRAATNAAPPAAVMNRTVVARAAPPPAPVPFSQQQSTLQANPGQPIARSQLNQMQRFQQPGAPPRPMYRQAMPAQTPAAQPNTQGNPQGNPNAPNNREFNRPGNPRVNPPVNTQATPQGNPPTGSPRFSRPPESDQPNVNRERRETPTGTRPISPGGPPVQTNQAPAGQPAPRVERRESKQEPRQQHSRPEGKRDDKKRAD